MSTRATASIAALLIGISPIVFAQQPSPPKATAEKTAADAAPPRPSIIPLKLNIVVSRYQAEKKVTSLPYMVSLTSNNQRVNARMGAQVPLPNVGGSSDGKPSPAYSYRDVGLFIDAQAYAVEPGLFRIDVTVSDSTIIPSGQIQGAPSFANAPVFRNLTTHNSVMLRDGQTTQLSTAADPMSGEIMRVDVTLTVVK